MNLPCCVNSPCQDPANPIANFSAEQPDQEIYIGYNSGWGGNVPPLGDTWGTPGCISFCQSTVSQADADTCAANQQLACTVTRGPTDPTNNPGWQNPDGNPTPLFSNSAQHCDIICPDNRVFRFTIPAGQYTGLNQAQADAVAQSIACIIGQSERLCMNDIQSETCVDEFYGDIIDTEGGTAPLTYSIISGSLPPDLVFEQPDEFEATISGTATTPGTYSFTVRVVDRFGLFMVKTYTIGVIGITNDPDDATSGTAYTFQFTAVGGTAPYTFSTDPDLLPDGLTLSAGGLLSGTATESGDFDFDVQVTDASGTTCTKETSISVTGCSCDTDWTSPGTCRLKITGYTDGVLTPCPLFTPDANPPWDGTFPTFSGGQYLATGGFSSSISGGLFVGANLLQIGDHWDISIAGDSSGVGTGMWLGKLVSACPIGVYTRFDGCQPGPATFTIEAYTP